MGQRDDKLILLVFILVYFASHFFYFCLYFPEVPNPKPSALTATWSCHFIREKNDAWAIANEPEKRTTYPVWCFSWLDRTPNYTVVCPSVSYQTVFAEHRSYLPFFRLSFCSLRPGAFSARTPSTTAPPQQGGGGKVFR